MGTSMSAGQHLPQLLWCLLSLVPEMSVQVRLKSSILVVWLLLCTAHHACIPMPLQDAMHDMALLVHCSVPKMIHLVCTLCQLSAA